ncbi:hypothetical protein B566_EDAN003923 [Ephemera danica]|nr:hypothetical protein B566_EDAN003923 [Ephemera danica]
MHLAALRREVRVQGAHRKEVTAPKRTMQTGTLVLTLVVLAATPRPTASFSLAFLRREIRAWMNIIQNNIAGPELIRTTQLWNFNPTDGIKRRQRFEQHYGRRGQYLVEAVGKGEEAFDALTGRPYRDNYRKPTSPSVMKRPSTVSVLKRPYIKAVPPRQVLRINIQRPAAYNPWTNLLR